MAQVSKSKKPMKLLVPPLKAGKKEQTETAKPAGQRRIDRSSERVAAQSTFAAAPVSTELTVAEVKSFAGAKLGLEYLQSLWPVRIDQPRAFRWGAWGAISTLPKNIGDSHRALLKPIADAIDDVQNVLRSYEAKVNLPRDFHRPRSMTHTVPDNFGALLRESTKDASWLTPEQRSRFDAIADGWSNRYQHSGLTWTSPGAFHRETEVERLAKLAGVELGLYPDQHLLAAKAAWDKGQREVVFSQSIGNSTGATMGVTRKYSDQGAFLFNFVRAKSGTFGHWQDI